MFFLPVLGSGGAEMNAVRLAAGLVAECVQPTYAVARGLGSYAEHLPAGVEEVVLPTGDSASSTVRMIRAVRSLARLIDERKPDCLCPVMVTPSLVALAARRLARHQPPVVLSIQNTLELPAGTGWHPYEAVENFLARRTFPAVDGIIALSNGVGRHLEGYIPRTVGKVEVIHNVGVPLDSQVARPEPDGVPGRKHPVRYLACGRLAQQKGYPYLLEAFARAVSHVDAELHILGDGPQRAELEALAARLGIADRVTFLGFRKNPFLHMQAADVFVLSSLWEGFANVIVEAMSMGTAVIAADCPYGPNEIINDGSNGLLVPPANAERLGEAMIRLGQDERLRGSIAAAGQQRSGDFSPRRIAAQYAAAFRRLAGWAG
jgi:glycosyltransferase involved in cell wall biosynthesis